MEISINDIPQDCIDDLSSQGEKDTIATYWREKLEFKIDRDKAIYTLGSCGLWSEKELTEKNDNQLAEIILWMACGDFKDYQVYGEQDSYGSDVFFLYSK